MNDTIENYELLKHVIGGLKATANSHPEFNINKNHIPSIAKRITCSIVGDCLNVYKTKLVDNVNDTLYKNILKENDELHDKIRKQAKCIEYFKKKLLDNNISC